MLLEALPLEAGTCGTSRLSLAAGLTSVVRAQAGGCGNFSDDHRLENMGIS